MDVPILVVDDEPANLLAMEAVLVQPGIQFAKNRTTHLLPTLAPSLIADLPAHEHDAAVAVVGLARRPGIRTPAVGVSHVEQLRFLPSLGRDQTEGEWIVMPVPAAPARYSCAAGRPARRSHTDNPAT